MTASGRPRGHRSTDDPSEPFTRTSWRYTVRRTLRRLRRTIGDDPMFLPIVLRTTPTGTHRQIIASTDIVIEGFPRSGNTFAYFALEQAEELAGRRVRIASHVHCPSQVIVATRERFPTLVLIRQPIDTIASLLIAAPHVRLESAFAEYIHHYQKLYPLRERFVIASFDEVTTDFGMVTDQVNGCFGSSFSHFDHSDKTVERVFAMITEHHRKLHGGTENVVPRPSVMRKTEKEWLLEKIAAPRYEAMLGEAESVYSDYLNERVGR